MIACDAYTSECVSDLVIVHLELLMCSRITGISRSGRYGVGGEYPMAAGSAAERAETGGKRAARFRGRAVVLTFSMQGQNHPPPPSPGAPTSTSLGVKPKYRILPLPRPQGVDHKLFHSLS